MVDALLRPAFSLASPGGARGRLSVLIFHRVLAEPDPLFPDEMHAARFDALCGWIRQWFHVLPLDHAVRLHTAGELPSRALAISFDDGYADNHDVALPILQRHGLNATFFIATGFLDGGRMWNDSVVEALRRCRASTLDLSAMAPGLGRYALDSLSQRRDAIHAILNVVKYLPLAERHRVVAQIVAKAGAALPDDLMMRSEQVRALRAAGCVVGAHTVHHPILLKLDAEAIAAEVRDSRQTLEGLLDEPVGLFAYPNGKPGIDYDAVAAGIVRSQGFAAAFSTTWGAVKPESDLFQLPRFTPWDRGRGAFGVRLLRNLAGRA